VFEILLVGIVICCWLVTLLERRNMVDAVADALLCVEIRDIMRSIRALSESLLRVGEAALVAAESFAQVAAASRVHTHP